MVDFEIDSDTAVARAIEQRAAGDFEGAIATLMAAAEASLADVDVVITLAQMLAETGQVGRAERWLRHALKLAPDNMQVRLAFGTFLGQTGRPAEAREILAGVREQAMSDFADEVVAGREPSRNLRSFLACAELNLARAALETGEDAAFVRDLVRSWLSDRDHWGHAQSVLADLVEREGLDPTRVAEEGVARAEFSPLMLCHLLEVARWEKPGDFAELERLVEEADALFRFDWKRAAPELVAVVGAIRRTFVEAVMYGRIDQAEYPALTALARPSRERVEEGDEGAADEGGADADQGDGQGGLGVEVEVERDLALELIAAAFVRHWAGVRDQLRAGVDVAAERYRVFDDADDDDQLALARDHYTMARAERFAAMSLAEALALTAPWAEEAVEMVREPGRLDVLGAADYVMFVHPYAFASDVLPVSCEDMADTYQATADGLLVGGKVRLVKTTGEAFTNEEVERLGRALEEDFVGWAGDAGDDESTIDVAGIEEDPREIVAYTSTNEPEEGDGEGEGEGEGEGDGEGEGEDEPSQQAARATAALGPWDEGDPEQWTVRERLAGLAGFGAALGEGDRVRMAAREPLVEVPLANGMRGFASAPPDRTVSDFIDLAYRYGWVSPRADWPSWYGTPAARQLCEDPAALAAASLDDLVRLVTTIVRVDRFVENSLQGAMEAGFVHQLVARAAAIRDEVDAGVPHRTILFGDARRA